MLPSSGWDDYDARIVRSTFVFGDLQTSSHPTGYVQIRVRRRLRKGRLFVAAAVTLVALAAGGPVPGWGALAKGVLTIAQKQCAGVALVPLLLNRIVPGTTDE